MVRSTHRVRAGTDIIGLGHGHQLSGCLKGLADLFPSVPRDRFPVTVKMFKAWSAMWEWHTKDKRLDKPMMVLYDVNVAARHAASGRGTMYYVPVRKLSRQTSI